MENWEVVSPLPLICTVSTISKKRLWEYKLPAYRSLHGIYKYSKTNKGDAQRVRNEGNKYGLIFSIMYEACTLGIHPSVHFTEWIC